jgi:anti-sigma B factor antagonist
MSAVKFIDLTGLGVIVTAIKTAQGQGGMVALFAMPPKVRVLVELTRLHLVFDIYPDETPRWPRLLRVNIR